jgi:hypothetical protein
MNTDPCLICGAIVSSRLVRDHQQWHKNISDVAIHSIEQIDALTERLNEVLHGRS